jgi:hypothetical protein
MSPFVRHPTCSYMSKLSLLFWSKLLRKCYFSYPTKFRNTSESLLCNYFILLSIIALFWKVKTRLCDLHAVCVSVCPPSSIFEWLNQPLCSLMCLDTWVHINGVLHISLPSICVSVCVYPPIIARQRFGIKSPYLCQAKAWLIRYRGNEHTQQ